MTEHKKKVLIVATVGGFYNFLKNDIRILHDLGYEVHCAANYCDINERNPFDEIEVIKHQVNFARSPFSLNNINSKNELEDILKKDYFDIIHCHTPVGGALARFCGKRYRKYGTEIIYTAHGFHFYDGAPKINWLLYYPVEKYLSRWTDILITINKEDYKRAKKKLHAINTLYVPGVGIDMTKFHSGLINVDTKRLELGVSKDDVLLLSVGELSIRKNHEAVIKALNELKGLPGFNKIHYFIAGNGEMGEKLEYLSHECGLQGQIKILGYRTDISELCQAADLYIFPSLQEGLSVALMEAIACKVPVICSNIRGNEDLIKNEKDMFVAKKVDSLVNILKEKLISADGSINRISLAKRMNNSVSQNYRNLCKYDLTSVGQAMSKIYKAVEDTDGGGEINILQYCETLQRMVLRQKFCDSLSLERDTVLLLSVGELNENKNHSVVIKAMPRIDEKVHYLIAGSGGSESNLKCLIKKLNLADRVHLLGYRTDVAEILQYIDVYLLPSLREGLNVSLMEAMASGIACICGDIRGNNDLIIEGKGGYRIKNTDVNAWENAMTKLCDEKEFYIREKMGRYNLEVIKKFSVSSISKRMKKIYLTEKKNEKTAILCSENNE